MVSDVLVEVLGKLEEVATTVLLEGTDPLDSLDEDSVVVELEEETTTVEVEEDVLEWLDEDEVSGDSDEDVDKI